MQGLAPGRIVHTVNGSGEIRAAIINEVTNQETGVLGLSVFLSAKDIHGHPIARGMNVLLQDDVPYSADKVPMTWHWPERERPVSAEAKVSLSTLDAATLHYWATKGYEAYRTIPAIGRAEFISREACYATWLDDAMERLVKAIEQVTGGASDDLLEAEYALRCMLPTSVL